MKRTCVQCLDAADLFEYPINIPYVMSRRTPATGEDAFGL
jgi:hypothetical protein